MATYKHGVYTSEQATSMTAPVTGTAGLQVVVGTAPVNMLEHPEQAVNTPLLAYNYKEAVAAVGYHDDFAAYTLCESISAAFSVVGTGPLVLINVLDPAKHRLDGGTWEVKTAYSPDIAEEKYQAHLREKGPDLKIGNDHELANYIETTILDKDCSPAAVLGFAMIEGKKFKTSLSVPTIYKYIAKGLFLNLTQEELPRHGKKKHKYKKVKKNKSASRAPAGESIEQRPEEIDEREEFGHWEGDTVYSGKGKRKTTRALLTLTERKTRKEIIIAIPNRKAETVVKALDALERKLGARRFRAIFKSITFDNGTEFAAAAELERSCVNKRLPRTKVYFCHPYSSWERGTNENTNGMIRRRFPKGTNFAAVTNAQIAQAENWINNYPRKILGYKSSEIVFRECLRELGIAA